VKAQGNAPAKGSAAAAAGANSISVTGLTVNTQYTAYIVVEAGGSLSEVLAIANVNPIQPDTAPPILTAFAVTDTATATGQSVRITFTSSEAGSSYYTVKTSGEAATTAAEFQNPSRNPAIIKTGPSIQAGSNEFTINGLTVNTTYTIYIIALDARENWSTISSINATPTRTSSAGAPWTTVDVPAGKAFADMVFGNGTFVAGAGSTNTVTTDRGLYYSTNGTSWTPATVPSGYSDAWVRSVFYAGPEGNKKFFACIGANDATRNSILYSSDGITWQASDSGTAFGDTSSARFPTGLAYGNGIYLAINSTRKVIRSNDGISWTYVTQNTTVLPTTTIKYFFHDGSRFVILSSGYSTLYYTDDGSVWNSLLSLDSISAEGLQSVAYNGARCVISGAIDGRNTTAYSDTLPTGWTVLPAVNQVYATNTSLHRLTYLNNRFVAVVNSQGGNPYYLLLSDDGAVWTLAPAPTGFDDVRPLALSYGLGKLFVLYADKIAYRND
jgi:hypothetical protein